MRQRLQKASWESVVEDVHPFLEPKADLTLLSQENAMQVLEKDS